MSYETIVKAWYRSSGGDSKPAVDSSGCDEDAEVVDDVAVVDDEGAAVDVEVVVDMDADAPTSLDGTDVSLAADSLVDEEVDDVEDDVVSFVWFVDSSSSSGGADHSVMSPDGSLFLIGGALAANVSQNSSILFRSFSISFLDVDDAAVLRLSNRPRSRGVGFVLRCFLFFLLWYL